MKFVKEDLQELAWGTCDEINGITSITRELYDETRWGVLYEQVLGFGGKFYKTTFELPATEYQEGMEPYDYEDEEIELPEAFPVEVVTTVYKLESEL